MTVNFYNNCENSKRINFRATNGIAPLAAPIESLSNTIEESLKILTSNDMTEEEKKSHKTAIGVFSGVAVLSTLVFALNPKYSGKILGKLQRLGEETSKKIEQNKDDFLKTKFYQLCMQIYNKSGKFFEFLSNFNSLKDVAFKKLCTEKKEFFGVENKNTRNILKKTDSLFRKIFSKPHERFTVLFDDLAKATVNRKYNATRESFGQLDSIIRQNLDKLSESDKKTVQQLLKEISVKKDFMSEASIKTRFTEFEESMKYLEREFMLKLRKFGRDSKSRWPDKKEVFNKNMSFWAQDIVASSKSKIEQQGADRVLALVGDESGAKGLYDNVLETMSKYLSQEEKSTLSNALKKASNDLKKANKCECSEYFDKKRDLVLGGAPTDVASAIFWLTMSGILISTADSKEERVTRTLNRVIPVIAGVFGSVALAAALISGPLGMGISLGSSWVLSKMGSSVANSMYKNNVSEKEISNA